MTIRAVEEEQYAIDFQAQLSRLQAFSICVDVMDGEPSIAVAKERSKLLPHCKLLNQGGNAILKSLIEQITEKKEKKVSKKMEEIQPQFKESIINNHHYCNSKLNSSESLWKNYK